MALELKAAAQQALETMQTNYYAVANEAPHRDVMAYSEAMASLVAALEQPQPPQEAETVAEKVAYCAGWWDALEKMKGKAP